MAARPIGVFDLRAPVDAGRIAALPAGARLQWREPLSSADLDAIALRADVSIRLYGAACAQVDQVLARIPVRRLAVESRYVEGIASNAYVRELVLEGAPADPARLLGAFAALDTLRVDARGAGFDCGALREAHSLARLAISGASLRNGEQLELFNLIAVEVIHCAIDCIEPLLRHGGIVAMRLAGLPGVRSIEAVAGHARLRVLALDRLLHLDALAPIATLRALESLELAGLWQFNVNDAAFVREMPALRRLAVDIGGRRKNVEITKYRALAAPGTFDVGDYERATS